MLATGVSGHERFAKGVGDYSSAFEHVFVDIGEMGEEKRRKKIGKKDDI